MKNVRNREISRGICTARSSQYNQLNIHRVQHDESRGVPESASDRAKTPQTTAHPTYNRAVELDYGNLSTIGMQRLIVEIRQRPPDRTPAPTKQP